jgi:hypothetical protein
MLPLILSAKLLEFTQTSAYLLQGKQKLGAVLEAVDSFKWTPKSLSDMYKMSHNLHMLWMCIHMSPYYFTAAFVDQAFVSCLQ